MDTKRMIEHFKNRERPVDIRAAIERLERAVTAINALLKELHHGQ